MEGNIEEKIWFFESRLSPKLDSGISVVEHYLPRERKKTVSVALVICLNVGVDPPDVVKPNPCARKECWLDPMALSQQRALEEIGTTLQKQYERWQQRARYKLSLDPTVEDVKKLCQSLRKNSKEERVLFHYNGHGVPKPTSNGEIWVFNKSYTQYIPLSIFDLQTWMGAPSIYVYDCNNAAMVIESFLKFAEQHDAEYNESAANKSRHPTGAHSSANSSNQPPTDNNAAKLPPGGANGSSGALVSGNYLGNADAAGDGGIGSPPSPPGSGPPNFRECIQMAACQKDQLLPMNPELPADLFTCCLTTPIKIAVLWYILKNKFECKLDVEDTDRIPGTIPDRRTMLGELNWIFTAITDTIAWNTLPPDLFQKLFRQDLLVASLFRNFLLANRIMRAYHCTPVSHPALPDTHQHPLWPAWDYALDVCIGQLPDMLTAERENTKVEYVHSSFFESQLSAFQVWLDFGSHKRTAPQQLPIVLQVLLSQAHRLRALELLGRFLDLGSWAVTLALSVGIFPYVLRLLHSCVRELRPLLSFIWAKILTVQRMSQAELVKDQGHKYFLQILSDPGSTVRDKTIAAFIIATIVDNFERGQEAVMKEGYIVKSTELLGDLHDSLANGGPDCYLLRQWLCIGLGKVWSNYDAARWYAIRNTAYDGLFNVLCDDPVPEVRAAVVHALGTLVSNRSLTNNHATYVDQQIISTLCNNAHCDGSALVRKELVVALAGFIADFESFFLSCVQEIMQPIFRKARQLDYDHVERLALLIKRRRSSFLMTSSATNNTNDVANNLATSASTLSLDHSSAEPKSAQTANLTSTKSNSKNNATLAAGLNDSLSIASAAVNGTTSAEEDEVDGNDYFDGSAAATVVTSARMPTLQRPVAPKPPLSVIRKCPSDDELQHSGKTTVVANRSRNSAATNSMAAASNNNNWNAPAAADSGSGHRRQRSAIDATASGTTGSGEKLDAAYNSQFGALSPLQPAKVKKSNSAKNLAFLGRGNSPPTGGQPSPLANLVSSGMSSSISTLFRQSIPAGGVGRSPSRSSRAHSLIIGGSARPPQDHREIEEMVVEASEKQLRSTNPNVRSVYPSVWLRLVDLATRDPDPEVRRLAQLIREHINRTAYAQLTSKLATATVQVQLEVTEVFPDGVPQDISSGYAGVPLQYHRSGGGARTISESSTGSETDPLRSSNPDLRTTGGGGSNRRSPIRFFGGSGGHSKNPQATTRGGAQFVVGSPNEHNPVMASTPNDAGPSNTTYATGPGGLLDSPSGTISGGQISVSNILSPAAPHSVKFPSRPKIFGGRDNEKSLSGSLTNLTHHHHHHNRKPDFMTADSMMSISSPPPPSAALLPKPFPLVRTDFVEWSTQRFVEPIANLTFEGPARKEFKKTVAGWALSDNGFTRAAHSCIYIPRYLHHLITRIICITCIFAFLFIYCTWRISLL